MEPPFSCSLNTGPSCLRRRAEHEIECTRLSYRILDPPATQWWCQIILFLFFFYKWLIINLEPNGLIMVLMSASIMNVFLYMKFQGKILMYKTIQHSGPPVALNSATYPISQRHSLTAGVHRIVGEMNNNPLEQYKVTERFVG